MKNSLLTNRIILLVIGIVSILAMGWVVANWLAVIFRVATNTNNSESQLGAAFGGQIIFNLTLFAATQSAAVLTLFFHFMTSGVKLSWWLLIFVIALVLALLLDLSYGTLLTVGIELIVGIGAAMIAGLALHFYLQVGESKEPRPE